MPEIQPTDLEGHRESDIFSQNEEKKNEDDDFWCEEGLEDESEDEGKEQSGFERLYHSDDGVALLMREAKKKTEGRGQDAVTNKNKGREKETGEKGKEKDRDRESEIIDKSVDSDFRIILDEPFVCTKDWEKELLVGDVRGGSDDR